MPQIGRPRRNSQKFCVLMDGCDEMGLDTLARPNIALQCSALEFSHNPTPQRSRSWLGLWVVGLEVILFDTVSGLSGGRME
eukprot:550546-Amphidinium_carterae.2